jgi:cation diffusion facilitator family transporter
MNVSLLASIAMLAGKMSAYLLTGSIAILSDALESVVHGVATGLAAFSLWYAARPADANHPYGHGRIAYFSAGFEGALVLTTSIVVIYSGIRALIYGPQLKNLGPGLLIAGSLALINLALGLALIRVGRKHHSLILVANGTHVLSDMWTTVAAIAGVGLVMLTGVTHLDPVTAVLLGLYIMYTGATLIRQSVSGLMDELDPATSNRIIEALNTSVRDGLIAKFHQLKWRRINDEIWIDTHLLVPGELTTIQAHTRASEVESRIRSRFPEDRVHVLSHVEPEDHESAHPGGHEELADPFEQAAAMTGERGEVPFENR